MSRTDREALPRDTAFDLLSNPRRRFVISYLTRVDRPVTIGDLAVQVAAWENDVPPDDIGRRERKRVYVSLYQTHVPKLADAGVVDYDDEAGTVELADRGHDLTAYLTRPGRERDWPTYYLAAAVAGAAAYLALAFDAPGLAGVPDAAAVAIVVVAFAAIAVAQFTAVGRVAVPEPSR